MLLRPSDDELEHALDDQFVGGDEVGILGVLGFEERLGAAQQEGFQRALAINQRAHGLLLVLLAKTMTLNEAAGKHSPLANGFY